jgi:hypothetical protein
LEHQQVFENQVVVPLDAHLELYTALKKNADELGDEVSFRRTDLALFDLDPASRKITCRLVEVKCYKSAGELATDSVPARASPRAGWVMTATSTPADPRVSATAPAG